jgi:hypothetical protein
MMVMVAVVAIAHVLLHTTYVWLTWLYKNPPAYTLLLATEVSPVLPPAPPGQRRPSIHAVGQPALVQCDFKTCLLPRVPIGLPYKVTVGARLMDDLSYNTTCDTDQKSYFLIAGRETWEDERRRFRFHLTPPRPGRYTVIYEVHVSDIFGHGRRVAWITSRLQAK